MPKSILYSVLNWGLGHATRSIPVINALRQAGHKVIIASDGAALQLLQNEYADAEFEKLPGYNVTYTKQEKWFNLNIVLQTPKILKTIEREFFATQKLCEKHAIDLIISDHRYGVFHHTITSVFIAHQLHLHYPKNKIVEKIANHFHRQFIEKFHKVWVPDNLPTHNLSGVLSEFKHRDLTYIGILSRMKILPDSKPEFDVCIVLSGPEPQRTVLEEILLKQCEASDKKIAFVRGLIEPEYKKINFKHPQSALFSYCNTEQLNSLIAASEVVLCRSGYSSMMDLTKLQKKALIIPTPGLPEQNYLAEYLPSKGWFHAVEQDDLNLESDTKLALNSGVPDVDCAENLLSKAIESLFE